VGGYDPVIFDLDGTIVDTVELIRRSFRYATRRVLKKELPDREIMAYVGQPLMTQMVQLSPQHAQELYDVYRAYNHRVHDEFIRGYAGIDEALAGLREAGKRLGLVTSKSADTTQMAFRAVGLEQHFDVVVTASDTTEHKPRPAPILLCLERLGAGRERPIYIGDSPYDVAAGKAAGIATAAVTWGLFSADDLADAGPDHLLTRPDEIVAVCLEGEEG
jgi:pyrophosphatase PpaX